MTKLNYNLLNKLIDEVSSTNSSNDKLDILRKKEYNKENIKQILFYVYNTMITFGVTSSTIKKFKGDKNTVGKKYTNIFTLLKDLGDRKLTGHMALYSIKDFIKEQGNEKLIYLIIDKNLKMRVKAKGINKVWDNLIPEFSVVLADKYEPKNLEKGVWVISRKLDGVRCLLHVNKAKKTVKFYSRQGKPLNRYTYVEDDIDFDMIPYNCFIDGELSYITDNNTENFKKMMNNIKRKEGVVIEDKHIVFLVFDLIKESDFYNKESKSTYRERYGILKKTIIKKDNIKVMKQFAYSPKMFEKLQKIAEKSNWEGLMLRREDVGYKGKRTKDLLKVKKFYDAEYKVLDIVIDNFRMINKKTGLEANPKAMVSVVIKHKGKIVNVGSGFSHEQRLEFYKNPKLIIGKIITVKYFEETEDGSLRFPTFKILHGDKRKV